MIHKPRLLRYALALAAALLLPMASTAQPLTDIGPIATNAPLGASPSAGAVEPRINWINGEYQETHTDLSLAGGRERKQPCQ